MSLFLWFGFPLLIKEQQYYQDNYCRSFKNGVRFVRCGGQTDHTGGTAL